MYSSAYLLVDTNGCNVPVSIGERAWVVVHVVCVSRHECLYLREESGQKPVQSPGHPAPLKIEAMPAQSPPG